MKQFLIRDLITYCIVVFGIIMGLGGLLYFDARSDDFEKFVSQTYTWLVF